MNKEQLIQQIEYCEKELKKLSFQTLSISKYKEFLQCELLELLSNEQ